MFYVYLLCSGPFGTLYIGMTADLVKRVWQHKTKAIPGFTSKYDVDRLVWYEAHELVEAAFVRERQLKKWKRAWKIQLIEVSNPEWIDLYQSLAS
ncbi:MAG TPA: GIY-YIG nuclease family protein [Stellaceae bacterium]|nr:GIY-YIG nuclease family protein [Stellaceae bacterium]